MYSGCICLSFLKNEIVWIIENKVYIPAFLLLHLELSQMLHCCMCQEQVWMWSCQIDLDLLTQVGTELWILGIVHAHCISLLLVVLSYFFHLQLQDELLIRRYLHHHLCHQLRCQLDFLYCHLDHVFLNWNHCNLHHLVPMKRSWSETCTDKIDSVSNIFILLVICEICKLLHW